MQGECHARETDTIDLDAGDHDDMKLKPELRLVPLRIQTENQYGNQVEIDVEVDGEDYDEDTPGVYQVPLCGKNILVEHYRDEKTRALNLQAGAHNSMAFSLRSKAKPAKSTSSSSRSSSGPSSVQEVREISEQVEAGVPGDVLRWGGEGALGRPRTRLVPGTLCPSSWV